MIAFFVVSLKKWPLFFLSIITSKRGCRDSVQYCVWKLLAFGQLLYFIRSVTFCIFQCCQNWVRHRKEITVFEYSPPLLFLYYKGLFLSLRHKWTYNSMSDQKIEYQNIRRYRMFLSIHAFTWSQRYTLHWKHIHVEWFSSLSLAM